MAASKLVYNSHGQKYEVPRVLVSSLNELQRADHIAFHRQRGAYWHHAIVEWIDRERGEIHVIEYSNTAQEFLHDNCSPPTITSKTIAKVVRGEFEFKSEAVYLLKHERERCLDPDAVILRAQGKLGDRKYSPFTNNCEHFATWCKTGVHSSDQINKASGMVLKEVGVTSSKGLLTSEGRKELAELLTETVSKVCQEALKIGVPMETLNRWFFELLETVLIKCLLSPNNQEIYWELRKLVQLFMTLTSQSVLEPEALFKYVKSFMNPVVWDQIVSTAGKNIAATGLQQMNVFPGTLHFNFPWEEGYNQMGNILHRTVPNVVEETQFEFLRSFMDPVSWNQIASTAGRKIATPGLQQMNFIPRAFPWEEGYNQMGNFLHRTVPNAVKETQFKFMKGFMDPVAWNQVASTTGSKIATPGLQQVNFIPRAFPWEEGYNQIGNVLHLAVPKVGEETISQAASKVGEEIVKTGAREASEEIVTQAASKVGEEIVKTGAREASEEIVTQAASKVGEEIVKTGAREASEEIVTQAASKVGEEIVKTGARETSEEIVTQAASKVGEEVAKTGVREGSEEVLTQSVSTGNSLLSGAKVPALIETAFAAYDIGCACQDMRRGTISGKQFIKAAAKRVMTGTGNVGGSTVGAAVGQVLIPVPFVGGFVGAVAGGILGKFVGNVVANSMLE